eukprot:2447847-Amphidinium_carterae.1
MLAVVCNKGIHLRIMIKQFWGQVAPMELLQNVSTSSSTATSEEAKPAKPQIHNFIDPSPLSNSVKPVAEPIPC